MATLTYKNIKKEFEPFIGKSSNLIKINLVCSNGDSEGIWAAITDEDKKDYGSHKIDYNIIRIAKLANPPVYIRVGWGTFIPYQLNGYDRPTCVIADIDKKCAVVQDLNDLED